MNSYQKKLEIIKNKRLNMQQRVNAFLKSASWILAAIYFIPFALVASWSYLEIGYGADTDAYGWITPLLYIFAMLNSLALIFLFFYSLVLSKKLLVRSLSGIKEK